MNFDTSLIDTACRYPAHIGARMKRIRLLAVYKYPSDTEKSDAAVNAMFY